MLTPDGKRLALLDAFTPDLELPKFKPRDDRWRMMAQSGMRMDDLEMDRELGDEGESDSGENSGDAGVSMNRGRISPMTFNATSFIGSSVVLAQSVPTSRFTRLLRWLASFPTIARVLGLNEIAFPPVAETPAKLPAPSLTPEQFFTAVGQSAEELLVVSDHFEAYRRAIRTLKHRGQQAFAEKLLGDFTIARAEGQLVALGLTRVLSEARVVELAQKSPRAISLTPLRNYTRMIPDAVIVDKDRADVVGAFDGYAVLHYDPNSKHARPTAEETRPRDPILFGLIRGSRRLYVVGDWIDGDDDLTLEKVGELLGAEVLTETKIDPANPGGAHATRIV